MWVLYWAAAPMWDCEQGFLQRWGLPLLDCWISSKTLDWAWKNVQRLGKRLERTWNEKFQIWDLTRDLRTKTWDSLNTDLVPLLIHRGKVKAATPSEWNIFIAYIICVFALTTVRVWSELKYDETLKLTLFWKDNSAGSWLSGWEAGCCALRSTTREDSVK